MNITIIVSAFSNLSTDQRIEKLCATMSEAGYKVILIGNNWGGKPELKRNYQCIRVNLYSKTLKTAYPEFQIKLYQELQKQIKSNYNTILWANDLDVLLSNYLIAKKYNIPFIYDSHEIYTEMPSVNGRKVQKIWRWLERKLMPHIKYMSTASYSYSKWFYNQYNIQPMVIQNFPKRINYNYIEDTNKNAKKVILYQGAINPSRGIDKAIRAMKLIDNAEFWIAGNGPKRQEYERLASELGLDQKVKFLGNLFPEDLRKITLQADLGLSIEENNGLSYYYSMPNKISDYIQAGVPVLLSDFPEMKKVIEKYDVGDVIYEHTPDHISQKIKQILNKEKSYYLPNLKIAAEELCWEKESSKLLELLEKVIRENYTSI